MAEAARACSNQRLALIGSWVMPPTTGVIKIEKGGDENITINHGCGGCDCGGGSNSSGDGGDGGGRESDGGIGCGRADNNGDDEDDDGGYGGGKSDNVTTVTGTVAMRLVVAAVAKATMMTLCQCTRVKCSTTQVSAAAVAAVAAVAVVDGEDGVQWRRWWGRSMAESAAR
jgi:hypothetical protein